MNSGCCEKPQVMLLFFLVVCSDMHLTHVCTCLLHLASTNRSPGSAWHGLVDPENLELESQLCLQTTLVRPGLLRHKLKSVMNSFTDLGEVSEGTADSVILSSA